MSFTSLTNTSVEQIFFILWNLLKHIPTTSTSRRIICAEVFDDELCRLFLNLFLDLQQSRARKKRYGSEKVNLNKKVFRLYVRLYIDMAESQDRKSKLRSFPTLYAASNMSIIWTASEESSKHCWVDKKRKILKGSMILRRGASSRQHLYFSNSFCYFR